MKKSLKYLLAFVVSGALALPLFAQKSRIDSLLLKLDMASTDSAKIDLMMDISSEYQGKNNDKAISYAKKAYALAKTINKSELVVQTLVYLGNSYYYKADYEKTIAYYLQALTEYEKLGNTGNAANILNNIGVVYYSWGQNTKALNFYNKSLAAYQKAEDLQGIAKVKNNIGNLFFENKNFDSALVYYTASLKIKQALNDLNGEALLLNNIGNIYGEKNDYKVARNYYLSSLKIYQQEEEPYGEALTMINIASLFRREELFDSALFYAQRALEISIKIEAEDLKTDCYELLTEIYETNGNDKLALENFRLYIETKNKIKSEEVQSAIEELNLKYETEKKEQQIALQESQIAKERLLRNSFIILSLLFVVFAFLLFRGYKNKQKTNKLLEEKNHTIEHQKLLVEEKQKALIDSILYAKRIQQALLTSESYIEKALKRLKN